MILACDDNTIDSLSSSRVSGGDPDNTVSKNDYKK